MNKIPSLDGIRAFSVLLVVLAHSGLGMIVPGGLGVTIFFFLSGYLITTLMFVEADRSGRIDILSFYARRIFRLIPPLLVTLAIAYGLTYSGVLGGRITIGGLASQLFYFANYYALFFDSGNTIPAGTGILWSLAVEEHFYIFYPLLMGLFLNSALRSRQIGFVFIVTCIVVLVWRFYLVEAPGFVDERTYYASDTRIDFILYGCILAAACNPMNDSARSKKMSWLNWSLFLVGLGVLLATLVYRNPVFRETARYSLQGIALMPIFYFAIRYYDNGLFRYLNSAWLVKIGVYSYVIYLSHYIIIETIVFNWPDVSNYIAVLFPIAFFLSVIYAAAIDRYVDPYFRNLRRRLHWPAPGLVDTRPS